MLAGNNFTENFNADVPLEIFWNVQNNIHNCFCWQIYQLLLKVMSLQEKSTGGLIVEEINCIEKILENETTSEVPG